MLKEWVIEPRMERAGLFSEESFIMAAVKEFNNPKVTFKRSTRGYTLLLENKPMNPVLAGKNRLEVESILHTVHCLYVKHLASKNLQKLNMKLDTEADRENTFYLLFSNNSKRIEIDINKLEWRVTLKATDFEEESDLPIILNLVHKIGKSH